MKPLQVICLALVILIASVWLTKTYGELAVCQPVPKTELIVLESQLKELRLKLDKLMNPPASVFRWYLPWTWF